MRKQQLQTGDKVVLERATMGVLRRYPCPCSRLRASLPTRVLKVKPGTEIICDRATIKEATAAAAAAAADESRTFYYVIISVSRETAYFVTVRIYAPRLPGESERASERASEGCCSGDLCTKPLARVCACPWCKRGPRTVVVQ